MNRFLFCLWPTAVWKDNTVSVIRNKRISETDVWFLIFDSDFLQVDMTSSRALDTDNNKKKKLSLFTTAKQDKNIEVW